MPKCRKRRICREPDYVIFQSENGLDDVTTLTVDEYEAIRQIDMEGLSQEECAKKMCVARTTAQLIYNSARKEIVESIVLGKSIRIEGGNYILCDGSPCCENCCKSTQPVNYMQKKGENVMRIAVTYENERDPQKERLCGNFHRRTGSRRHALYWMPIRTDGISGGGCYGTRN